MADPLLQWISDTLRAITDEAAPAPTKIETPNGVTIGIVRDGDEFEFDSPNTKGEPGGVPVLARRDRLPTGNRVRSQGRTPVT